MGLRLIIKESYMKRILLASLMLAPVSAFALDWTQPIYDSNNAPIPDCDKDHPGCGEVFTLGKAATTALFGSYQDEPNLAGEEKFKRATLAMRLKDAKDYTPTAEDIATIKKLVAKAFAPIVVMRVWRAVDPGVEEKK